MYLTLLDSLQPSESNHPCTMEHILWNSKNLTLVDRAKNHKIVKSNP